MDQTPNTRASRWKMYAMPLVGFVILSGLGAVPARAHAILVESSPVADAAVTGPDVAFDLRYNSRIDQKRSRLTLKNTDGSKTVLAMEPETQVDHLKAHATALVPGSYTLRWQVLATDGHITRGDVPFSIKAATPVPQSANTAGH